MTARRDLETELTYRAWTDDAFAKLLANDPAAALELMGVTVPQGVRLDVRVQHRDTLYYVIPPLTEDEPAAVVNQIDLWRSGELFLWIMPEPMKVALLDMRQQYRQSSPDLTQFS